MTEEFAIGDVHYVVEFTKDHGLHFHADVHQSIKSIYQSTSGFWDEPPERMWTNTGTGNGCKIKRKILTFLDHALHRYSPHYFTFSTVVQRRIPVYDKIAKKIGKKYGYHVSQDGYRWHFTRSYA